MERDRKETRRLEKVVLIGYRAAGKTTVGRLLAGRLGWSYVDVDRGIEEHCRLTIREIIERHGEPYYRDVESAVVAELCTGCERVVAFGAGTPMRAHNREHARRASLVVYLEADAAARAVGGGDRDGSTTTGRLRRWQRHCGSA